MFKDSSTLAQYVKLLFANSELISEYLHLLFSVLLPCLHLSGLLLEPRNFLIGHLQLLGELLLVDGVLQQLSLHLISNLGNMEQAWSDDRLLMNGLALLAGLVEHVPGPAQCISLLFHGSTSPNG